MSVYKLRVSSGHYNDEENCKQSISVIGICLGLSFFGSYWSFSKRTLDSVSYLVKFQFLSAQVNQSVSVLCNLDPDCTVW